MPTVYNLGQSPFWFFTDLSGKALTDGFAWFYNYNTPNILKSVYSDPNGLNQYPNPIPLSSTGFIETDKNLYFADDAPYYIKVTDSPIDGGTILYQSPMYSAPSNSGGGGGSVSYVNLTNLITNGQFIFNRYPDTPTLVSSDETTIAPSNHSGLVRPDIILRKSSSLSTETINFVTFNQGESIPDQTPRYYLEYVCSGIGAETQKDIEFPISNSVRTLEGNVVTFSFWGRSTTSSVLECFVTQYFGTGNNSPDSPFSSTPQVVNLTPSWVKYTVTITVPLTLSKTIGNCGDDYLVVAIRSPLNQIFNINITNVFFIDGAYTPEYPYVTQDQTSSIIFSPRTGDVKMGFNNSNINNFGWLLMDDGSIGSSSSTATTKKGVDTFPLYHLLWVNVNNAYAPVSGGRGVNASDDFSANKTLTLTKVLGRALACAGQGLGIPSNFALGETFGEQNHTLTIPEIPSHQHAPAAPGFAFITNGSGSGSTGGGSNIGSTSLTSLVGGGLGHNTMQPTSFMNVYIKL